MKKANRLLSVALVLTFLMTFISSGFLVKSADSDVKYDFSVLEDGTARITKINISESTSSIIIPAKVSGGAAKGEIYVSELGDGENHLIDCGDNRLSVYFDYDSYVKKVNSYAFFSCNMLETVYLPDSLESIGAYAFSSGFYPEASTLLRNVRVPEGVTEIGEGAFANCTNISQVKPITNTSADRNGVTIPSTVETIKENTFANCKSIFAVELPEGLATIEDGAFINCEDLFNIVIPGTLKSLGTSGSARGAFSGCYSISRIYFSEGSKANLEYIGENAFFLSAGKKRAVLAYFEQGDDMLISYCSNVHFFTHQYPSQNKDNINVGSIYSNEIPDNLSMLLFSSACIVLIGVVIILVIRRKKKNRDII